MSTDVEDLLRLTTAIQVACWEFSAESFGEHIATDAMVKCAERLLKLAKKIKKEDAR